MKLLLAGGGTAGHIEPALAVARGWIATHPEDQVCFLGTSSGLEITLVPKAGYTLLTIPKVAISRRLSPSLLKVPIQLATSILATMKHLNQVDCAIGFGGYVSAPLYVAAKLKRVPYVIHEQNAKPGWSNRIGALMTPFVAMSSPVENKGFHKAILTGLPLRGDVISAISQAQGDWNTARIEAKQRVCKRYALSADHPLVFIFGGSQGSQAINKVIYESQPELTAKGYSLLHGVGKANEIPTANPYYKAVGYIDEMADCYLAADILISRSGAVTCAEATALSRFTLFIPLPIGNGEQALNAKALVAAGRARLIDQKDFTSEWLTNNIDGLLSESRRRPAEGETSGVHATDKIISIIEQAAGVK